MKKLIIVLGLATLFSTAAFANDIEKTTPEDKKSERWYQKPKTSIEFYGVIDIGYSYTHH